MPERELLILTAMQMESKIVRRALKDVRLPPGVTLRFLTIGISASQLPDLFCKPSTTVVIMAGFGGALRPDLALGEIILETHPADFASHLPMRRANIHTADQLIATPAHKAEVYRQTGACAVEMEFAIVRKKMGQTDIPLIHVRSISDSSEDHVDEILMGWIDPVGRPKLLNIATSVLANPRRIKILAKLQSAIKTASPPLGHAVRQIVESFIAIQMEPQMDTEGHR